MPAIAHAHAAMTWLLGNCRDDTGRKGIYEIPAAREWSYQEINLQRPYEVIHLNEPHWPLPYKNNPILHSRREAGTSLRFSYPPLGWARGPRVLALIL